MAHALIAGAPRVAALAVAATALMLAVAAIVAADPGTEPPTTYAAALPAARVADIVAGLGMVIAGAVACAQAPARRLGVLMLLAGVAWFGVDWEGAVDAPPLLRSLGAVVAPLSLLLVLHLVLSLPHGHLRSRAARAAVVAGYALVAAVTVARALVRDPLLDLYCWRNCSDNTFLVHPYPTAARALGELWLWMAVAIGLGLIAVGSHRLRTASRPARRVAAPLLVPAVLVGAAEAAYAAAVLRTPLEDPERVSFAVIFLARSFAFAALAAGLAWTVLRVARTRARVARVANELGEAPPPGKLRDALAAALGDPDVDVLYVRGDSTQLVDARGLPSAPPPPGRAVARVARHGRPLALGLHDAALADTREIERAIGAAARLAVENEALRAEALAQLHELRASRTRIVEAADTERRRLERNLHDGAQQQLLAVAYELRLARDGAARDGDENLTAVLDDARGETGAALDELRRLAHGIHPAILTELGLTAALATLADVAPLPVVVGAVPTERQAPAVEITAHVAVASAIEDAQRRGASYLAAAVTRQGDQLVVTADDDGRPRSDRLMHLSDRVGALGGSLQLDDTTLRAEIPCA